MHWPDLRKRATQTPWRCGLRTRRTRSLRLHAICPDAQVAIYTVDARGLVGNSISDPSETGRDVNGRMQLTVDAHMKANSKEIFERFNKEESLTKVAQETGGRVFLNTNDFDRAIVESVRDSSTFYQVGYYPSHKQWAGKFHTI